MRAIIILGNWTRFGVDRVEHDSFLQDDNQLRTIGKSAAQESDL